MGEQLAAHCSGSTDAEDGAITELVTMARAAGVFIQTWCGDRTWGNVAAQCRSDVEWDQEDVIERLEIC